MLSRRPGTLRENNLLGMSLLGPRPLVPLRIGRQDMPCWYNCRLSPDWLAFLTCHPNAWLLSWPPGPGNENPRAPHESWAPSVDSTGRSHDQAVSAATGGVPPPQQPSSLWVQEEREGALEVSILGLQLVLTLLLSASLGNPCAVKS